MEDIQDTTLSTIPNNENKEHLFKTLLYGHSLIQCQQYAEENVPGDPIKQKELIEELQKKYYDSYLEEVIPIQLINQTNQIEQINFIQEKASEMPEILANYPAINLSVDSIPKLLIPAKVWTADNVEAFKKEIYANHRDYCIKVPSLATATVRVPTHKKGKRIMWEFSTDSYDLGFGLFFEWTLNPSEDITVSMNDSSDEEDEEEDDDFETDNVEAGKPPPKAENPAGDDSEPNVALLSGNGPSDVEGGHKRSERDPQLPMDELIPVLRRNCHEKIYCGSHEYPGVGNYLLKFDNSFSMFRSKWLYYRVCYAD